MTGVTDIHSHFVYGVDDGAQTAADMEAMLDAAYADGIAMLFATPHFMPGVKFFDFDAYERRLDEARAYCRRQGYAIALRKGAEVMYTPALPGYVLNHPLPTLGDSDHVLLELVPDITLPELMSALELLERNGYVTVLAHIERYACLFHGNAVGKIKERYAVKCQVNTNTVLNKNGFFRTRRIRSWFQDGLVDFVASDAHGVRTRPYQMKRAYVALKRQYGQDYARLLTGMR